MEGVRPPLGDSCSFLNAGHQGCQPIRDHTPTGGRHTTKQVSLQSTWDGLVDLHVWPTYCNLGSATLHPCSWRHHVSECIFFSFGPKNQGLWTIWWRAEKTSGRGALASSPSPKLGSIRAMNSGNSSEPMFGGKPLIVLQDRLGHSGSCS